MLFKANAFVALLLLTAGISHADVFTFTYQSSGGLLAGSFNGTLQGDNNTFVITSVVPTPTLDGTPGAPIAFVDSVDHFYGFLAGALPTVTLDGSFLDVLACGIGSCSQQGFAFAVGTVYPATSVQSSSTYGAIFEDFDVSQWSASVSTSAVPEPGSILLLFSVVGVVGRRLVRPRLS